jgi:hypothetical protein
MTQFPQYTQRPAAQYPLVHEAEARQHPPRKPPTGAILFASACVIIIIGILGWVVMTDSPARGAADRAAVVSPTSAVPTRKPVEQARPVPTVMDGDGMYIVGREVKPGIYRTDAEQACWWGRLRDLRREASSLITGGYAGVGAQYVEILKTDKAFTTKACGRWVRVS